MRAFYAPVLLLSRAPALPRYRALTMCSSDEGTLVRLDKLLGAMRERGL